MSQSLFVVRSPGPCFCPGSARGRHLIVIPGEEVKTATEGEVIGLFLKKEIPRGMSFRESVAAIRAQGGLVYVPHPFDRLHAIPDAATLQRHLGEIDVPVLKGVSLSVARGEMDEFRRTLSNSLGTVFLLTIPSSVGLVVLGKSIIGAIYQDGRQFEL